MTAKSKCEKLWFSFLMSAGMILFMCSINKLSFEGVSWWNIFQILIHYPLEIIFVMLLSDYVAGPLKEKFIGRIATKHESKNAMILFNALFLVTFMSAVMTLCGPIIGDIGYWTPSFFHWVISTWFDRWRMNFCMAFFINLLLIGPFSRKALTFYQKYRTHSAQRNRGGWQKLDKE